MFYLNLPGFDSFGIFRLAKISYKMGVLDSKVVARFSKNMLEF